LHRCAWVHQAVPIWTICCHVVVGDAVLPQQRHNRRTVSYFSEQAVCEQRGLVEMEVLGYCYY
jgi:hypothetical protein